MTPAGSAGLADLADLAAWAGSQSPRLTDRACAATVDRIPFYRDGSVVDAAELRPSVAENLRFLIAAITRPEAEPLDLAAPSETGRRRARQGAPLPEVLQCHANTVRYRLRRLQELTGRSLGDPHGVAELAAAAYAVRFDGGGAG